MDPVCGAYRANIIYISPVCVVPLKRGIVAGERLKNTHATLLHSSYLNEEEERDPPTGAPRHYQQIDESNDRRILLLPW